MLYRWCHHVHHQYHSPFALMTQYLHPWELFCVGLGITIIPWMFKMHIMTYWCWFCVSSYVSIEVHCGYDFPWALHNWCPIYGGAPKHDLHHARPMSNFEPWLNYLDKLCGRYIKIIFLIGSKKLIFIQDGKYRRPTWRKLKQRKILNCLVSIIQKMK